MFYFIKVREGDDGKRTLNVSDPIITGESISVSEGEMGTDNFEEALEMVNAGRSIKEIKEFTQSNDRISSLREALGITVSPAGTVYVDGIEIPGKAASVFRDMDDYEDGLRFKKFIKRVNQNPRDYSRESLIEWVSSNDSLEILEDGRIKGYRGLDSNMRSIHCGYGIVNGVEYKSSHLDNSPGNIIEFPVEITDHSKRACSVGLHVGTLDYAMSFGVRYVTVAFAPEDVISDLSGTSFKIRVSKMEILEEFHDSREV